MSLGDVRLRRLPLPGQAAAHGDDHGPVDDGLVVGGQPLVVADGPAVPGDPGQGALDDPAAGQHLEGVQVIVAADDLEGELERGGGPGDQFPGADAVGPGQPDRGERLAQVPMSSCAACSSLTWLSLPFWRGQGTVPLGTTHCTGWPVTCAISS